MKKIFLSPTTLVLEIDGEKNILSSPSEQGGQPNIPPPGFAPSRKGMTV